MKAQIGYILDGDSSHLAKLKILNGYLEKWFTPIDFSTDKPENYLAKMDADLYRALNILEALGVGNPKGLTMYDFCSKIEYFESRKPSK